MPRDVDQLSRRKSRVVATAKKSVRSEGTRALIPSWRTVYEKVRDVKGEEGESGIRQLGDTSTPVSNM